MAILNRYKLGILLTLIPLIVMSSINSTHAQYNLDAFVAAEGISLTIDFGNGTTGEYSNLNGSNVLEVTSSIFEVDVQWFGPLAYIKGIESVVGGGEYGWQYWVNGEFASTAVNQYLLDDNDSISWVYSAPVHQQESDPTLVPGVIIVSAVGFGFLGIVYITTSRRIR